MRIHKLELKQVGPFEQETIEFPESTVQGKAEIHVLTGPNGAGKSTVLSALASCFQPTNLPTTLQPRMWGLESEALVVLDNMKFQHGHSERRICLNNGFSFDPVHIPGYLAMITRGPKQAANWLRRISKSLIGGPPPDLNDIIKPHLTLINNITPSTQPPAPTDVVVLSYSGNRAFSAAQVTAMKEITQSPYQGALSFNSQPELVLQWIANLRTKEALLRLENKLEKAEQHARTLSNIETAIKQITDTNLRFIVETEPLQVVMELEGDRVEMDALPDGLKSIISWIADLYMRLDRMPWIGDIEPSQRNMILLLDEIEVHLHPRWQRKILPIVQTLFPNAQIFVSTHSPFVVGSISDAFVYRFEIENQRSKLVKRCKTTTGNSYNLVLDEIFGLDARFDIETEQQLDKFYKLRDSFLQDSSQTTELLALAQSLAHKGLELRDIIGRELAQLARISGKELPLS